MALNLRNLTQSEAAWITAAKRMLAPDVRSGQRRCTQWGNEPMEWMLLPLKRYADFSGRSRRKEYWMFSLLFVLGIVALSIVTGICGGFSGSEPTMLFILPVSLLILALFVPTLAVQVRRFHDQDKSGWYVLLGLIPYVGGIVVLVFMCIEGNRGSNRFGPDPKEVGSTLR